MHVTTLHRENRLEAAHDRDDEADDGHRRRLYDDETPRQSTFKLGQLLSNMDASAAALLWDLSLIHI